MKKLFIIICAVFIAGTSFATEPGYLYCGLDYMAVKYEYSISVKESGADLLDEEADINVLRARFGYYFLHNFAIEGMVGVGVGDDQIEYFGAELDLELEQMFGIFLLGEYPATDYLKLYVVAGFSSFELKSTINYPGYNYELSEKDSMFSASIGLEIKPSKNLGITIEYSELVDAFDDFSRSDEAEDLGFELDYDMSAISLGFKYYF
jgi:opacity protein-like surface antigen